MALLRVVVEEFVVYRVRKLRPFINRLVVSRTVLILSCWGIWAQHPLLKGELTGRPRTWHRQAPARVVQWVRNLLGIIWVYSIWTLGGRRRPTVSGSPLGGTWALVRKPSVKFSVRILVLAWSYFPTLGWSRSIVLSLLRKARVMSCLPGRIRKL